MKLLGLLLQLMRCPECDERFCPVVRWGTEELKHRGWCGK